MLVRGQSSRAELLGEVERKDESAGSRFILVTLYEAGSG